MDWSHAPFISDAFPAVQKYENEVCGQPPDCGQPERWFWEVHHCIRLQCIIVVIILFCLQVNTFQCVLASDGTKTFAIYLYLDEGINWTTGDDAGGEDGLGGLPAQVGFDAGDGVHFLSVEGSFTDDIINIETKSNVDIPGLFVFQINGEARSPTAEGNRLRWLYYYYYYSIVVTCPVVGTTACNERIIQIACQYLSSTVATVSELPLSCP